MTPENELVSNVVTGAVDTPVAPTGPGSGLVADVPPPVVPPVVAAATGSEGQADGQGELATPPPFQIPEDDTDLAGQENQPHVPAILNLRKELRERNARIDSLQSLEGLKPYGELGELDVVKQYVDLGKAFFSPVIKDGVAQIDSETGLQEITAAPAIEMLEREAPGYVDNLLVDILNSRLPDGAARINQVFKWYGLNPDRFDDYKNIDTLLSQVNGAVTEDELANVPPLYKDVYKTLPQAVRDDLQIMSPLTRENYLRSHKSDLEVQRQVSEGAKTQEAAQNAQLERTRQEVQSQQLAHLTQVRQEEFNSINQTLSDWKPSADDTVNGVYRGMIMATLASLLDSDLRVTAEPVLAALGIKLDSEFDAVVNRVMTEDSKAVAYDYYGSKVEANIAKAEASKARQQLRAKLSSIASQAVKKLDGSRATPPPATARPSVPVGGVPDLGAAQKPASSGFSDEWALNWARERGIIQ